MADTVYSVKITLESVLIKNDEDWFGPGEIYFLGKIGPHSTGRSKIYKAGDNTLITLTGAAWTQEFLVAGSAAIPITLEAWDEDLIWDDYLGKVTVSVGPPWDVKKYSTAAASGEFVLNWTVANTIIVPAKTDYALVSRQHDGSTYKSTLVAPLVAIVEITDVLGLNKPGFDDRVIKPAGTTKNSSYQAGYISDDNKGRIFTNRKPDGTWVKDTQYVEVTAEVFPLGVVLPAGSKMVWTIEDPDDPTNEDPRVRKDAGEILDPNDYTGGVKTDAKPNDNDPRGKADETYKLEEIDPKYALAGLETLIDIPNRISKVRLHVNDIAGDNYRIKAEVKKDPKITLSVPGQTGIMTVWHRVELEYVKMNSAAELPVDEIAKHYDMACAQVDVSLKRVVTGAADKPQMDLTEAGAHAKCDSYATKAAGQFTKEGEKGWFFIVAANSFMKPKTSTILYEGDAEAFGNKVQLPVGTVLGGTPAIVRVFNDAKIGGMLPPKPNDFDLHIKFRVDHQTGRNLFIVAHDFHEVDNPDVSFLDADLSDYGFAAGAKIPVQVLGRGDQSLVTAGISPGGADVGGKHYFGGRLLVFTKSLIAADYIRVLCHELCHAFDNAHKCGNWDWINQPDKTACCMNYWFQFVLDDGAPRKPIVWTQNRVSAEMCARHLRNIRDYHLEKNPGLGW